MPLLLIHFCVIYHNYFSQINADKAKNKSTLIDVFFSNVHCELTSDALEEYCFKTSEAKIEILSKPLRRRFSYVVYTFQHDVGVRAQCTPDEFTDFVDF